MQECWAVLFDWDGVIVDSAVAHERSWERLAQEAGHTLPPGHFKRGFGMKNEFIIPNQLRWASDPAEVNRLARRKEALYREVVAEMGLEPLPGVVALVAALHAARVPMALASSTPRENIRFVLDRLGLQDAFRAMITAEDVSAGKPDPQVFLKAADALGMPPARCVVFEDTVVGIEAGRAAGMKVVAVVTTNPPELLHAADRVVRRLTEVSVEELKRLMY